MRLKWLLSQLVYHCPKTEKQLWWYHPSELGDYIFCLRDYLSYGGTVAGDISSPACKTCDSDNERCCMAADDAKKSELDKELSQKMEPY